ncbi:MAG TPA: hypothetical protein VF453_05305 [Burkholderiaceae bacterium]
MSSRPPGVLGTSTYPGDPHDRVLTGAGSFRSPAPAGHQAATSLQDIEHRLTELAHGLSTAVGWHQKQGAAYKLRGQHSFTAGVLWGMSENLAETVISAVDLVETLALAEYWESKQEHSLIDQVRANMFFSAIPGVRLSMTVTSHFWPGFDKRAQEAYEERGAIIDAVEHAFTHPKDFFGSVTKVQEERIGQFVAFKNERSLSGNFKAGKLLGELLFDLLMVIDLAVGLAKLALAVPRLARYTEDLAKLAREFAFSARPAPAAACGGAAVHP